MFRARKTSNPIREPETLARVEAFIAENGRAASNSAIRIFLWENCHIFVTIGQVAAAIYKEGIKRSGPIVFQPVEKPPNKNNLGGRRQKRIWTNEEYAEFDKMWIDGVTTPNIALRFNISESSVRVSRARRKLTPRQSSYRAPRDPNEPPPVFRAKKPAPLPTQVPPLPSQPAAPPVIAAPRVRHFGLQVAPMPKPAVEAMPFPRPTHDRMTCQSVQGTSGFGLEFQVHFCGEPVMLRRDGKPRSYCPEHCARYHAAPPARTPAALASVPVASSKREAPSWYMVEEI